MSQQPPAPDGDHADVVRMWEGRAAPGREDDVRAWLVDVAVPGALAASGCTAADAYAGDGGGDAGLVVLITRWAAPGPPDGWDEGAPDGLLARQTAWPFRPLP